MNIRTAPAFLRTSFFTGAAISLVLVVGGPTADAEGLTGYAGSVDTAIGGLASFTATDLNSMDSASLATDSTAVLPAKPESSLRSRPAVAVHTQADANSAGPDVFPHSTHLMPLLVARPDALLAVVQAPNSPRSGAGKPVGVTIPLLRSPTPSERVGR